MKSGEEFFLIEILMLKQIAKRGEHGSEVMTV